MVGGFIEDLKVSAAKIVAIDILLALSMFFSIFFSSLYRNYYIRGSIVPDGIVALNYPFLSNAPTEIQKKAFGLVERYGYAFLSTDVDTPDGPVEGYLVIGNVKGMPAGEPGQAWVGHDVELGGIFTENYFSLTFNVVGRLDGGSVFYSHVGSIILDRSVMMWLDADSLFSLHYIDSIARASLLHNAVLLNPDLAELTALCVELGEAGIRVNPAPMTEMFINDETRHWILRDFYNYCLWLSSGYCALCACLCCVQLSVRKMREFCVHMLYGATWIRLFLRLLLFNVAVLATPCIAVAIALAHFELSALPTVPVCLALALLIATVSYAHVRRDILTSILKGART